MKKRTTRTAWWLSAILAVALLGGFGLLLRWGFLSLVGGRWPPAFMVDCGTLPPHEAFEEVFGRSVPAGVTDIKGAGIPQSGFVLMRLRATDAAIKTLTKGKKPDASQFYEDIDLQSPEPHRVQWEETLHIRKPECFHISIGPDPGPDYVDLVVDRQRHLVYARRHYI